MRTRLSARFVVGYEGDDHVVYPDGEVVYEDERIVFAGHGYGGPVDVDADAGDALVGPGFIDLDALADIDHGVFDTFQPPALAGGLSWSEDYFRTRRREVFSPAETRELRRYALVQLLLNGITTAMPIAAETYREWAETEDELAAVAEIAGALGLRMYLGPSYRSGSACDARTARPPCYGTSPVARRGCARRWPSSGASTAPSAGASGAACCPAGSRR